MPSINDNDVSLWLEIAYSWYSLAVDEGVTGLTPPSAGEDKISLMKKTAYYTASLAS